MSATHPHHVEHAAEHHVARTVERHCDVVVIGGSAAGLAAALQLGRQRRSVIVVDAGDPRNAPAAHMHGYLGHDGISPSGFLEVAREEARSYGVEVVQGRAIDVTRNDDGSFHVALVGGHAIVARRVLAATGLVDELPDIDGVAEHWGGDVIHCPFCHGYEVRDRRIVQIISHEMGLHPAVLFHQLTEQLTLVLHAGVDADHAEVASLRAAGVVVIDGRVARLLDGADGRVSAVELDDGRRLSADVVVVGPRFRPRVEPFASLGLGVVAHPSGLGDVVETDLFGEAGVAGLYAAGNVTDPGQQVLHAAANGSRVGAMISSSLAAEDLHREVRASGHEADWDHRYSGAQLWSGNPNGTLVAEMAQQTPGEVLDVGAGEGGDAIWFAEQGWAVTANDVSSRALARVAAEAERRGHQVAILHVDANAWQPFAGRQFDLVSAQYASIPRTPDRRGVDNLLGAVRPGGTLLVVSHDIEPMRRPIDTTTHSRPFDAEAFVRVADFVEALEGSPDWLIEVHEHRPRPAGATSSHHVDDVVLRARRLG